MFVIIIFLLIIVVCIIACAYWQCYPKYKYAGAFRSSNYGGEFWEHKKVLILAPHPDDDINLAGELITGLKEKDCQVISVIATNGDSNTGDDRRIAEGLSGAAKLGLKDDEVVFLGYGNSLVNAKGQHIGNGTEEECYPGKVSDQTYGLPKKQEFCYNMLGVHHKNSKQNMRNDI